MIENPFGAKLVIHAGMPLMNIPQVNESIQSIAGAERSILRIYREVMDDIGIESFRGRVLEIARQELGSNPSLYYAVLKGLIDSGCLLTEAELTQLWQEGVNAFSFRFHINGLPSTYQIDRFFVHINRSSVLDNLNDGQIIPKHILEDREFDQATFESNPDEVTVCFVQGTSDLLARFLVGHMLLNSAISDNCELLATEGVRFFLDSRLALAPATNSDVVYYSAHDCSSLLTCHGTALPWQVPMFRSRSPVKVEVSRITPVFLTPDQQAQIFQEGRSFYRQFRNSPLWGPDMKIKSESHAAEVYLRVRHLELAVQYSLNLLQHQAEQAAPADLRVSGLDPGLSI